MMKEYDSGAKKDKRQKEAVLFIKQKIDAAKWFIDAIKQRQHTLLSTMTAIMNHQHEFFLTGDETTLKPMILKDIAEETGLGYIHCKPGGQQQIRANRIWHISS